MLGFSRIASADPLTVKTAQGKVHGKTINDGKVKAFLGLPYAAPPVGELRWKAPQPAQKWKGARDASKFGAHCVQGHVYDDMIFQDDGENEDCLFLNVYVPATAKGNSKLPVMFWIHGGGYSGGSGDEPRHNGDFLPLKGVVLVTINYRLGVFGFLATSDLAKEANGAAGNYGLMDMVAALQWVHDNIQKFGGDPANVTIFGESAGSFAVSTLMAAPSAQGLFAKAIGESGGALGRRNQPASCRGRRTRTEVGRLAGRNFTRCASCACPPRPFLKLLTSMALQASGRLSTAASSPSPWPTPTPQVIRLTFRCSPAGITTR